MSKPEPLDIDADPRNVDWLHPEAQEKLHAEQSKEKKAQEIERIWDEISGQQADERPPEEQPTEPEPKPKDEESSAS